jgi:hypothetical protein
VRHPNPQLLKTAYIILDYIKPKVGTMLSNSWSQHMGDPVRRENLFHGLARIMLSLARIPFPRIGSFQFHDDGTLTLTNRPLSCSLIILENNGAKRIIERDQTYTTIEPYISDLLTCHDNRFLTQPNAVNDEGDCRAQMVTMTILRSISHHFFERAFRGTFRLDFTDLHQSNIFVDQDWNVTCLVDLEWVCSLPVEMRGAPVWLTGQGVDTITGERLDDYNKVRLEFMRIFAEEEKRSGLVTPNSFSLAQIMESGWKNGRFWYCLSLVSINGMYTIFDPHVRSRYYPSQLTKKMDEIVSHFWCHDAGAIIKAKVAEKAKYDEDLRALFGGAEKV